MNEIPSSQAESDLSYRKEAAIMIEGRQYPRRNTAAILICFLLLWAMCYVCLLFSRGTRTTLPEHLLQHEDLLGQTAAVTIIAEAEFCHLAQRPDGAHLPTWGSAEASTPKVPLKDRPGSRLRCCGADCPIILAGETFTADNIAHLQAYQQVHSQLTAQMRRLLPIHQTALLCGLLLLCYGACLQAIKKQFFLQLDRVLLLTIFLGSHVLLTLLSQKLFAEYINGTSLHLCVLLPVCLIPALTSNLLGRRVGYSVVFLLASLTPLLVSGSESFQIYLFSLFGGLSGAILFCDIRKRQGFLFGGLGVAATMLLLVLFFAWYRPLPWVWSHFSSFWPGILQLVFGNALLTILALLLCPLVVERFFDIVTLYKLNEFNDRDHPLLLRLQEEAPGTYEHSLDVARLAGEAARAIGANSGLAEVCAYFHDIGKLCSPRMFAENQTENETNPHDQLSPQESSQVLREHVRHGLELARKHRLQRPICEAIAQHHGNSQISYFYHKAKQQAENENLPEPELPDFSYTGQQPQRPEVVIVSLADASEAAVRCLVRNGQQATSSKIADKVNEIFLDKLQTRQLDQAGLTLAELFRVRDQIVKTLCNIHHLRPDYPRPSPAAEPANETAPPTPQPATDAETATAPTTTAGSNNATADKTQPAPSRPAPPEEPATDQ